MDDIDALKHDPEEEEEEEEEDDVNADEDFNPDKADAEAHDNSSSSDESEDETSAAKAAKKTTKKRKVQPTVDGELDSGDEATIKERKRKKRRKDAADANDEDDEESGGEGGLVRTRAQRVAEKEERKNRKRGAREGAVTIDVDKIWAELSNIPIGRIAVAPPKPDLEDGMEIDGGDDEGDHTENGGEMITIQTWANFAGQLTPIEKEVPRNSKEAQEYLKKQAAEIPNSTSADGPQRPLKRPSMFEPNPMGLVKGVQPEKLRSRAPTRMDIIMAQKRAEAAKSAGKLSTVQMSQYDWKKYVEKEGYQEELDKYKKSDVRFLEREAFLDRAAGAREQAARDARLKL